MYASIANTTTVNQPTATASAAHPSTVAPSTVNESTVRRLHRHKINVVRAKFGHNKLFKLFTSVAVTDDSTTTAKTLIDCGATLDFVSRAYLTRHKITARPTGKELVISFPNGSQQRSKLEIVTLKVGFGNYSEHRTFTVADLTTYDVIYGRPWLASHQPHLNWRNNDVRFRHRELSVYVNASADFGEDDVILTKSLVQLMPWRQIV